MASRIKTFFCRMKELYGEVSECIDGGVNKKFSVEE